MANPSLHYIGAGKIAPTGDHSNCERFWQGQIAYHASKGYNPAPAYNFAACNEHGIRMEGRGWGMDSAANGVDDDPENENLGSRALVMLIGSGDTITPQLERCVREFTIEAYSRGMSAPLRPHSSYVSTDCCGANGRALCVKINSGAPADSGDDDDVILYIAKKSEPNLGIFAFNSIHKRHVNPDEWAVINGLADFTGTPRPGVVTLTDQWWNSIPTAGQLTLAGLVDVSNVVKGALVGLPGGSGGNAPTRFNITLSGAAQAA